MKKYGFQNYYQKNYRGNYYNYIDIDRLKITETNMKEEGANENTNFGYEYEHSIITKSLINLKIHSINERKVYTKENRKFYGLKVVIIKNENYFKIPDLLDKGKFKVIPFSNQYYELEYPGFNKIYILINSKNLKIRKDKEIQENYFYFNGDYYDDHTKSKTAKNDSYKGYIHLYNKINKTSIDIMLYASSCEIDGLFVTEDKIDLSSFQLKMTYSNCKDNYISPNSLIIYEIKSRNQEKKLVEQMEERGNFIYQYLNSIYDKQIYYIGFYRKRNIRNNILLNNEIEDNKIRPNDNYINGEKKDDEKIIIQKEEINNNNNKIEDKKYIEEDKNQIKEIIEIKDNKNGANDNQKKEDENTVIENNNNINNEINNEKVETITTNNNGENGNSNNENENQIKENKEIIINKNAENYAKKENIIQTNETLLNKNGDKSDEEINTSYATLQHNLNYEDERQTNEIILNKKGDKNEGENNTSSQTEVNDWNYSFFDHLNFNVIIFEVGDKFFGEDLKYDKEEYNLLNSIKNDVNALKKEVNEIRKIEEKNSENLKNINEKLDQLLNNKK